jgi:hypothetical protein
MATYLAVLLAALKDFYKAVPKAVWKAENWDDLKVEKLVECLVDVMGKTEEVQ